jgi:metallo-beta-lactamase family protein
MCEAGRIRHHLKHNLHRRDSTILFVGFQAQGTLGRVILDGARRVRISGEDIEVEAEIRRIDSYSAHADRGELHDWIKARFPIRGSLFLNHGEPDASEGLAALVQPDDPALDIVIPQIGETYSLSAGLPAKRTATGRPELVAGADWQNDYADFAANLKRDLASVRSAEARRRAIADMRRVLDSYAEWNDKRRGRR